MTKQSLLVAILFFTGLVAVNGCAADTDEGPSAPSEEDEIKKSGSFACGPLKCKFKQEYCVRETGGARPPPGQPPGADYECRPLPTRCQNATSTPTCDSCGLTIAGRGMFCSNNNGKVTVNIMRP